jgi:hypothetical protein
MSASDPVFAPWPKIPRLLREICVTEKIDGTNASISITRYSATGPGMAVAILPMADSEDHLVIRAASRTRWLHADTHDNFGWAAWVRSNAEELTQLGEGNHFGEWWGAGIQRGYDRPGRTFSLFNAGRWCRHNTPPQPRWGIDPRVIKLQEHAPACCSVVPVLYRGEFSMDVIDETLSMLERDGSAAAPGFANAEGVIVWHEAAQQYFKQTIGRDAK